MSENIKLLTTERKPNPDAIEQAKRLLAMCEGGQVQEFAVAMITTEGVGTGWTSAKRGKPFELVGAIEWLKLKFMHEEL